MRINYENGSLYMSFTDEEVDQIASNKHTAIKVDIRKLKVLHEDVSNAVSQYWRDQNIDERLQKAKGRHNI
jgi:hypothetical protein|tara:strand:- start:1228 stop:1440 length:213 start_codon:yes stop_codon:yes gene_type:complete